MNKQLALCAGVFALLCMSMFSKAAEKTIKPEDIQIRMRYQVALRGQDGFLLLPGNRILEGVPNGGLDTLDYDKICAAKPEYCGTYTLKDGQLTITWGGKRAPVTWKHVVLKDGQEEMAGAMWMKGEPFKAGQRLDGNYQWSASAGDGTATTAIAAGNLVLRPDGTYTQGLAGSVRSSGGSGTQGAVSQSEQTGTYEVHGYTLTLQPKGGAATRHTFLSQGTPKDRAKPSIVCYDSAIAFRSDK